MTRVVVFSKKNSNILHDAQLKSVVLDQPSIVQIGVNQADIKSIIKQGNDLVITLKNGEKIIVSDFYTDGNLTENSLAISKTDGSYAIAEFDDSGKFVGYSPATSLAQFAYTEPVTQAAPVQSSENDLGISKSQLWKVGLAALVAEGAYLWAVKDDDKDDKNKSDNQPIDITPPAIKATIATDDSQTITVKTEANVRIEIKDSTGKILATGQADAQGNYTFKLSQPLPAGEKVTVTAIDSAGNATKSEVIGNKDVTPPDAPMAQLNADGTIVSGKTEANAKVSIYDADRNLLGTVTANKEGLYSIKVSPPLTSDKGGTVIAEDAAGNKSTPSKVIAGKDTLPPDQPLVDVNKEGTSIQGRAEANSKVQIKDADGKVIGSGTADAQGKFQITLSTALAADKKASIIIEDAAGNQSKPLEITAGKDTIAPDKALVQINAAGDSVTGTAEANSKVEIRSANGKTVLGTGTADAEGKFTITLSPVLTDKNIGKVYVVDAAGNRSEATDVIGTKDTIAPNSPVLQKVTDDVGAVKGIIAAGSDTDDSKPKLEGMGEAKAVLTIYDNGQPIGTVTVGDNGNWSFEITKDLALGLHKITLTQTDAAGNISEVSSAFSFNVVAPAAKASLADTIDLNTLQTHPVEPVSESTATEKPAVNELLTSSNQASNQLDSILDQLLVGQTPTTVASNSENSDSAHLDYAQSIKADPLDQLAVLQHSII
ncbi:Ig-like repeat protein Blp2 [Acinetobacter sp. TUM15071]|uniref:Ig-like repeat protein Blp2 n=1 Tax=Acinetobacter sp. TUM15071 TaxID=2609135 RepID=UPI00124C43F1|nr:Ig-like repeat protein Blp2 [Acinetobacter sp. TUM15071]